MKTKLSLFILLLVAFTTFNTQAQILYSIHSNGGAPMENRNVQTVTDWLHYDGDNATRIGNPNGAYTIGTYVKLTSTLLNPHIGRQIEELQFYIGDLTEVNGDLEIRFYSDLSSTPVYTQTVATSTLTSMDWNTVVLSTPYQIANGNDLYVGYFADMQPGYFSGADDGSNFVTDVNYLVFNGTQYELGAAGLPRNWNIRAGVGGAIAANDCGVSALALDNIIVTGNQPISGTLTNYGSTTLTQVDINYQINNGATVTETLNGLSLATGDAHTFTFSTPWNATPGNYNVDVWTSNFNGNGQDDVAANDHMAKTVQVASQSTQNLPLYEEFTSSTCNPCATLNGTYFTPAFLAGNTGKYSLIKYQMNWPGNGDPYYTAEGGDRRSYYGVTAVPTLFLDGIDKTQFDTSALQTDLDAAYAAPAYFDMSATYTMDANHGISVDVSIEPYLNGDYTLHCAVVEKTTTGNVGSNGETEFYNVMMKMVPDANGTNAALAIGQTFTTTLTASIAGTFVEDWNDLEVVVFLQDDSNKNVMQSAIATETSSGISDDILNNISIYPNPATSSVYIKGAENMNIEVLNITGAVIMKKDNISNTEQLNTANLPSGMYLIKFTKNNKSGVKKLMIL